MSIILIPTTTTGITTATGIEPCCCGDGGSKLSFDTPYIYIYLLLNPLGFFPLFFPLFFSENVAFPQLRVSMKKQIPSIPPFHVQVVRDFRSQHDMRKFVLSALACSNSDDVVLELGNREGTGVMKLREILESRFATTAGNRKEQVSFQRVIVPLCHLLTQQAVQFSPHLSSLNVIYTSVFACRDFFPRLLSCVEELLADGRPRIESAAPDDTTAWDPHDSITDVLVPVVNLFSLLLTRVTDAQADPRVLSWQDRLEGLCGRFPVAGTVVLRRVLDRTKSILAAVSQASEVTEQARRLARMRLDEQMAFQQQMQVEIPLEEEPGPGDVRPGGPRHGNDHADYRSILVIPTEDEVLSDVLPYVPRPNGSLHVAHPVDRYLDIQFRLLREDMLACVRRGVKGFVDEGALTKLSIDSNRYRTRTTVGHEESSRSDGVALLVFRNVQIVGVVPGFFSGVGFNVEFDQLHSQKTKSKNQCKSFWDDQAGSSMLQVGSLVCLVLSRAPGGRPNLEFGMICERKVENLADVRCRVSVKLLNASRTASLMAEVTAHRLSGNQVSESVMLQVRGHFFAGYGPVLEALQAHAVASLPFSDVIVGSDMVSILRPPTYLGERGLTFNLACLRKSGHGPLDLIVRDYEELRQQLRRYENDICLDVTQIDAFALGLTRSVALIQGPPGTGKTYVGVQLVRALLANSSGSPQAEWRIDRNAGVRHNQNVQQRLDPILCICYTNHALDQFLEDLVKKGVPLEHIVRVGGRSKSEVLATRSLHALSKQKKSPPEYKKWIEAKQRAQELEASMDRYSSVLCRDEITVDATLTWLQEQFPDQHEILIREEQQDGFQRVGGPEAQVKEWLGIRKQVPKKVEVVKPEPTNASGGGFAALSEPKKPNVILNSNGSDQILVAQASSAAVVRNDRVIDVLLNCLELWNMSVSERQNLWRHWHDLMRRDYQKRLQMEIEQYETLRIVREEIDTAAQLRLIKTSRIVGFTTSGCAKYQTLLRGLSPRVVLCEEAGEVLESHIVASLTSSTQHLILIGDHMQLRPKVDEYSLSVASGVGFDLDISLFERLVRKYERAQLTSLCTLQTQRRMRPEIADMLRGTLYPNLTDDPSVVSHPPLRGFAHNLWFFDHNFPESSGDQQSFSNLKEAHMVVELVRYAIRQGYSGDRLAVLTPYVGQLLSLKNLLSQARMLCYIGEADMQELDAGGLLDGDEEDGEGDTGVIPGKNRLPETKTLGKMIRLATVDNFQGEEADLVFVSTVRCNPRGRTGFLKISNRVNVMLSRAKHGMIVFGSASTIRRSRQTDMFAKILDMLDERQLMGPYIPLKCFGHGRTTRIGSISDFEGVTDGGCSQSCGSRLMCGHVCKRMCHPDDPDHFSFKCLELCNKMLPCGHACHKSCFDKCGDCKEDIVLNLPCGHAIVVPCGKKEEPRTCSELVNIIMPLCQHPATLPCLVANQVRRGDKPAMFSCQTPCGVQNSNCGHTCSNPCGKCSRKTMNMGGSLNADGVLVRTVHPPCKRPCDRDLFCGHRCAAKSCHGASECPPCASVACLVACEHSKCGRECKSTCAACSEPCSWRCEHQGACPLPCGSPCIRLPCDRRCEKLLDCGHQCPSVCGERCPERQFCQHCGRAEVLDTVVDVIMGATLREHDPNDSPVIVLSCNHAWTMETLDGHLRMGEVYSRDGLRWLLPLPLIGQQMPRPTCPTCRHPISGTKRYGRILNHVTIDYMQRKFIINSMGVAGKLLNDCDTAEEQLQQLLLLETAPKGQVEVLRQSLIRVFSAAKNAERECRSGSPVQLVFEKDQVALQRRKAGNSLEVLTVPNPTQQPLIETMLVCARASRIRLRFLCVFWSEPGAKTDNSKKRQQTQKPSADSNRSKVSQLQTICRQYAEACSLLQSLSALCDEGKAVRLAKRACEESVWLHYALLEGLESVNDASATQDEDQKRDKSARDVQVEVCNLLENALALASKLGIPTLEKFVQELARWKRRLSGEPFYDSVSVEEKRAIFAAMSADVGGGVGSYGGHWYECPNGHVYTIGECGGAMQQSTCPECGAVVGGGQHRLQNGNRVANGFLQDIQAQAPPSHWRENAQRDGLL